jgi:hypothetical protein
MFGGDKMVLSLVYHTDQVHFHELYILQQHKPQFYLQFEHNQHRVLLNLSKQPETIMPWVGFCKRFSEADDGQMLTL